VTLLESLIHDLNRATPTRLEQLGQQIRAVCQGAETPDERKVRDGKAALAVAYRERRKLLETQT
jgi:hypothetical protein